jgi:hypothetical protein
MKLGSLGVGDAIYDQRAIGVVNADGPALRTGDAAAERGVVRGLRYD